ncbi:MAG: DUF2235 domain-containing protein, partial [Burkholderiales bacterium]|nr:DUF2235 domain-containing protein [Burkholderiales bacterium]
MEAECLRCGADQGAWIPAQAAPKSSLPGKASNLAGTLANRAKEAHPPGTCVQTLWFSFFFDGTGNNLDADVGTLKHSNVARLFRAHPDIDVKTGVYRFYIPGVGTYFKE